MLSTPAFTAPVAIPRAAGVSTHVLSARSLPRNGPPVATLSRRLTRARPFPVPIPLDASSPGAGVPLVLAGTSTVSSGSVAACVAPTSAAAASAADGSARAERRPLPALLALLTAVAAKLRAVRRAPSVRLARAGAGVALAMVGLAATRGSLGTLAMASAAAAGGGGAAAGPMASVMSVLAPVASLVPEGLRGVLRPFGEAFGVVFLSEFGDKSMFATALMAMKHSPILVLLGALAALTVMTLIACFLGQLMHLLPAMVTHISTIALFVFFGLQMIWQSRSLPDTPGGKGGEQADAEELVAGVESSGSSKFGILAKISSLIFVAEWCDRSMLATMALAASSNTAAVVGGATLANVICTGLAVGSAALVSSKISERMVALCAGILFEFFAVFTFFEGPEGE